MGLITWNTEGSNPTCLIFNSKHGFTDNDLRNLTPNFICIQEGGSASYQNRLGQNLTCGWNPLFKFYNQINTIQLKGKSYIGYHIPWQTNANGNPRCSMAILWRADLGGYTNMPIAGWHDGNNAHRPVFWVTPTNGNNKRIGCIHAPSGGGPANDAYITQALQQIDNGAPNLGWILAGDFNREPGDLTLPHGVHTFHTGEQTHKHGGNYDYLIYTGALPYNNCAPAQYLVSSDHFQVRFV